MKPNWKDYLKAVGKFISILLLSVAICIAFLGVMYLCMRYETIAVIVCLGVLISLVGGFVVSTVYNIAKGEAAERVYASTVATNFGRLTFVETMDHINEIDSIVYEELSNFTPKEQIIVLDGLRKSPIKEFKVSCYAVYPFDYLENIEWREEPEYIKTYDQIMEDLRLDIERDL